MEFKSSFSILVNKFGIVFRTILFVFIVILIVAAFAACFFVPANDSIKKSTNFEEIVEEIKLDMDQFLNDEINMREAYIAVSEKLRAAYETGVKNNSTVKGLLISMLLLGFLLFKFCISMCYITVSDIINEFMRSNLRYGFLSNFIKNFKKSLRFASGYTIVTLPIDLLLLFSVWGVITLLLPVLNIFAFTIALALGILLAALRLQLFSGVIPYMICENKLKFFCAMRESMPMLRSNLWPYLRSTVLTLFLYYMLTSIATVPTFGLATLFSVATFTILINIQNLCFYYTFKKAKYYVDSNTVVDASPFMDRRTDAE